jgi:hypothetical protein
MAVELGTYFEVKERLAGWPEMEAGAIEAELVDGIYRANILPKFETRIRRDHRPKTFPIDYDLLHNGVGEIPNPLRVSAIKDNEGQAIGYVGISHDIHEDLVIDPEDPESRVALYYELDGDRIYIPETSYFSRGGLRTEPRTFSVHDIHMQMLVHFDYRGRRMEHLFAEITPANK